LAPKYPLLRWHTGQSGVHRTCPVNYSGLAVANSRSWRVPEAPFLGALDTVRCTPDSPVNYSGAPLEFPEGDEFELESSGAPDSPVRQTRDAFGCPFALLLNPILGVGVSRQGVPKPTSECAACPSPDGSSAWASAKGGEARWPESSVREVEVPRPSCASRAQVRCACSRGVTSVHAGEGSERP
jgi:hypothetical protein